MSSFDDWWLTLNVNEVYGWCKKRWEAEQNSSSESPHLNLSADPRFRAGVMQGIGWCHTHYCRAVEKGEDITQMEVPDIIVRARRDLIEDES